MLNIDVAPLVFQIFSHEATIVDDLNTEHVVTLKLNINTRAQLMVGWSIALKLHQIRIDGIDWHSTYSDPDGKKHQGWHRHRFDQRKQRASERWPTEVLNEVSDRTQFLIRTLKEMDISLNAVDHGSYDLF